MFYFLLYFFYSFQILNIKHESISKHGNNFRNLYKLYYNKLYYNLYIILNHHCEGKQKNDNFIRCLPPNEQSLKK